MNRKKHELIMKLLESPPGYRYGDWIKVEEQYEELSGCYCNILTGHIRHASRILREEDR